MPVDPYRVTRGERLNISGYQGLFQKLVGVDIRIKQLLADCLAPLREYTQIVFALEPDASFVGGTQIALLAIFVASPHHECFFALLLLQQANSFLQITSY